MSQSEDPVIDKISRLNNLLVSLNANSFDDKNSEICFDEQFLRPDFDIFLSLVNHFNQIKENCYKRSKLLSLISDYIYSDKTLSALMLTTCQMSSTEVQIIGSKLETILVSIPEIISNNMKTNYSQKFEPKVYFKQILKNVYSCVEEVHQMVINGRDSSLQFLSSLLGRIAFIGFSELVFKEVINKMTINCEKDFIWRRIAYRVIVLQQKPEYIEVLIKSVFCLNSDYKTIVWIFGKTVETNIKIKFLLSNKFLLINEFKSDQILINIFGYLSDNCLQIFFESISNLLNAWSNSSAIKYRSYSQHLYLSRALMIGSRFMKNLDLTDVETQFRRLTMNSIEVHLKNSQTDFRNIGLTVGQTLMSLFCGETNEINFEIEENEEIRHLNELFANNCNQKEVKSVKQNIFTEINDKFANNSVENQNNGNHKNKNSLDSDDDEDNDLIPYDMSNDIPIKDKKRPFYLRDCMEGLLDPEKNEWFSCCLESAEQLIRDNEDCVEEIAVEFTQILFRLDDSYGIHHFIGLRMRALIALCVCSPKNVANYLCSQFYASNHTIRQRLDVLEVLLSASSQFSSNDDKSSQESYPKQLSIDSSEEQNAEKHWQQVVNSRIAAKTRLLSHKSREKTSKEFVNRLAPLVSHFFFPLLKGLNKNLIKFDLIEEDHYVFGRLAYTLAIIIKNVSFCPITKQMGRELLDFILAFRYHSEPYVREALIFAFCMVLMSVPPIYLINEMSVQIVELQLWLKDITEREANTQCIEKAFTALQLLKEVVKEMPLSLDTK